MAVRLLMPPGICACKWTSPAARLLVALAHSQRQVPVEQDREDDDHEPGCPASPLAAGMGVKPAAEPLLPPGLALDPLPLDTAPVVATVYTDTVEGTSVDPPPATLYLTLCALLI
jgi:hypothetical protein